MKNILEQLYYGNLNPEEKTIPTDPEYRPVNRKITELLEEIRQRSSEQDFEDIEQIMDLTGESHSMLASASFASGLRIGVLLMIEVFAGESGIGGESKTEVRYPRS